MTPAKMELSAADNCYWLAETHRILIARCYVALAEVDYELRAWAAEVAS